MARAYLIESNEALITIDSIRGGKPFAGESPFIGKTMTESDVLDEGLEHATRILRMDISTLKVEDITEEVAKAWLIRTDAELGDTENGPLYVATSAAFQAFHAVPETAFKPNVYSTLDKRTQGLAGAAL